MSTIPEPCELWLSPTKGVLRKYANSTGFWAYGDGPWHGWFNTDQWPADARRLQWEPADRQPCPSCGTRYQPFGIVWHALGAYQGYHCSRCERNFRAGDESSLSSSEDSRLIGLLSGSPDLSTRRKSDPCCRECTEDQSEALESAAWEDE